MGDKIFFGKVDFTNQKMMDKIYALRYKIYCEKKGFLRKESYPSGLESDELDKQSVHFAAVDSRERVLGYLRLILPGKKKVPISLYLPYNRDMDFSKKREKYSEISRFMIDNEALGADYRNIGGVLQSLKDSDSSFLQIRSIALGLFKVLYIESVLLGMQEWYAMIEKPLYLLLRLYGINFRRIGDAVEYFGVVFPYMAEIPSLVSHAQKNCPCLYSFLHSDFSKEETLEYAFSS